MTVGFLILMAVLAAGIVGLDQWTKALVVASVKPAGSVTCIPGLLNWTYVENRGAAFGMMQNQRWLFILITVVLLGACAYYLIRHCESRTVAAALTLVVGGGVGNMVDRVANGFVVDFVSVSFFPPVFNFADACVVVGAIWLIALVILQEFADRKKKKEAKPEEEAPEDGRKDDL